MQTRRKGDENVFETVFTHYYSRLYALSFRYLSDKNECEEVVQDVMLWLWENKTTLIPEMRLQSLLFTIVKNKCLNMLSHREMKQRIHEQIRKKVDAQFEDPDFYLAEELEEILKNAIEKLPFTYREAFQMNRFRGLSYDEIAQKTGVSSKTIAYRIMQALKLLRVACKDYLPLLFLGLKM